MQAFYKKAMAVLVLLMAVDVLLACCLAYQSYLSLRLLPADDGVRWRYGTHLDASGGGTSSGHIPAANRQALLFDFKLTDAAQYPFVDAELVVQDADGRAALADISKYTSVTFTARCMPANTMVFGIATFDDKVSKQGNFLTYPSPLTFFSCNEEGVPVNLDLTRLTIPQWWFDALKLDISHQKYQLDKVAKFFFGTSSQSPRNVDAHAEFTEVTLHGRDYRYLYALAVLLPAGWLVYGVWYVRAHARALVTSLDCKLKKDLPLVAYRQLTLEPYRDKEKASVLRFIATNYSDPELDLERVVGSTGANRNKVNELLKSELGMTFTAYLNKLRLAEAARLLTESSGATVAQVAYSVGYTHVSYFNKLFKEEYGCTPKAFRTLAARRGTADMPNMPVTPHGPHVPDTLPLETSQ